MCTFVLVETFTKLLSIVVPRFNIMAAKKKAKKVAKRKVAKRAPKRKAAKRRA